MKVMFPLVAAVLVAAAADAPTPESHQFTVLYVNNRLGELNPCG